MVAMAQSAVRRAPAVFVGWQSWDGVAPDTALFNLTEAVDGHPVGSTVSRDTLERAGFYVPPIVTVRHNPRGGWTHAYWHSATLATYHGDFASEDLALKAAANFCVPVTLGKSSTAGCLNISTEALG